MNEKEIDKCVSDCLNGNNESFNSIFRFFEKKIFNFCYHFFGSVQDAEDATIEVFLKVYKSLEKFDRNHRFTPWVYKIAHNHSIEILRKKKREKQYLNTDSEQKFDLIEQKTPATHLFEESKEESFKKGLKKIPKNFQDVLMLKYYHNLTYQQIGDILNLSRSNVGIQILRGKKALKNEIMRGVL